MTSPGQPPLIALGCGGTGGHLFPGLAVASELIRSGCAVKLFVSTKDVDQQALRGISGPEVVTLPAIGLQRGGGLAFLRAFGRSYRLSRNSFLPRPPKAALAMGGFTSAPPILAARRFGAATFLHESNFIPGRANRWLSWFVDRAFIGFPSAGSKLHTRNTTHTGTPVRSQFSSMLQSASCRARFGLDQAREVVLVMGGSQGAHGINDLVRRMLPHLATQAQPWQWLHLAGPDDAEVLRLAYRAAGAKAVVQPFCDDMEYALGAATVAVARAGASSLAELAAVRLPAILIPYPTAADDHQFHNARAFEQTGAALLFAQQSLSPEMLAAALLELVGNPDVRGSMRAALAAWHSPRAAEQIAQAILQIVVDRAAASAPANSGPTSRGHASAIA